MRFCRRKKTEHSELTSFQARQEIQLLLSDILLDLWREHPHSGKAVIIFFRNVLWAPILVITISCLVPVADSFISLFLVLAVPVLWIIAALYFFSGLFGLAFDQDSHRHNEINPLLFALTISLAVPAFFINGVICLLGSSREGRGLKIKQKYKEMRSEIWAYLKKIKTG